MTLFFKNYITRKYDDVIRDSHIPPIYRIIFHDKKGLHKQAPLSPGKFSFITYSIKVSNVNKYMQRTNSQLLYF